MVKELYQKWLHHPNTDETLKTELKSMNEKEINDAFYKNIEFGTAGMRGILGAGSNRINIHTIRKATVGFGQYILNHNGQEQGVAIGYDNRHMSYEFAMDCAKVLASMNIKVYVFERLRPTPELSFAVRHFQCFGGIMITASHNPKEYNGYKLYDALGCQLVPHLASQVIDLVNAVEDELAIVPVLSKEQEALVHVVGKDVDDAYYKEVLAIQLNANLNKTIKIVFSPEHGASNLAVQSVLKEAGYHCILVEEQATADPDFSNTESPNPEDLKAYKLAIEYAKKYDADVILVCDPDGDRMGVAVKKDQEYKVLTGNQTGAVLIEYILSQLTKQQRLPNNAIMFNTVVTSDLGEKIASSYGVETEKTLTGFKFIGEKVAKYEINHEKTYVFGYEESYGSLIKDFVRDKDATQACLMLAEACNYYALESKTLYDVLLDLYHKHGTYDESQIAITLKGQEGALKIQSIMQTLRERPLKEVAGVKVIGHQDFQRLIEVKDNQEKALVGFIPSDVLKFYLEDGSWIAVRPSGTEPKCKIYFDVVGSSEEDAKKKATTFHKAMQEYIK